MTIDLNARKKKLTEDVTTVSKEIEKLQIMLQQASQARERMLGAMQMLDELLAPEKPQDD